MNDCHSNQIWIEINTIDYFFFYSEMWKRNRSRKKLNTVLFYVSWSYRTTCCVELTLANTYYWHLPCLKSLISSVVITLEKVSLPPHSFFLPHRYFYSSSLFASDTGASSNYVYLTVGIASIKVRLTTSYHL